MRTHDVLAAVALPLPVSMLVVVLPGHPSLTSFSVRNLLVRVDVELVGIPLRGLDETPLAFGCTPCESESPSAR